MSESDSPNCALRRLIFIPLEGGMQRPVPAEQVSATCYRTVGSRPEGERWIFGPGQVVECEVQTGPGTSARVVAVRAADDVAGEV